MGSSTAPDSRRSLIRSRKIGPLLATLLVASNMVGSGIYLLPATLATVGSITVVGSVIAAIGAGVLRSPR